MTWADFGPPVTMQELRDAIELLEELRQIADGRNDILAEVARRVRAQQSCAGPVRSPPSDHRQRRPNRPDVL